MDELMDMLMQYQQNNQQGDRFGLNLNPISGIQHYRVNPTRGYLAQDGGVIQQIPQAPFPGSMTLTFAPGTEVTSEYPLFLQQGGTVVDTINRVPSNIGMRQAGQYEVFTPQNAIPSLPLSGSILGQSLVPNRQMGGYTVQPTTMNASQFGYTPTPSRVPPQQEQSLLRVLNHWSKDEKSAERMKTYTGSDVITYEPTAGLKGDALQKAQAYNKGLEESGLLGKPWAMGLEYFMMAERNGWLEKREQDGSGVQKNQLGGLIQEPVVAAPTTPPKYIPIQPNPSVYLPFQFEQDGEDAIFRKVKTKGLSGQQKTEAEAWNRFIKDADLKNKPISEEMMQRILNLDETVPGIQNLSVVPQAGLGKFFRKVGKGIWDGVKGVADVGLSVLGAPNVIDNTFVDRSRFLTGATNVLGTIGRTALTAVNPLLGAAISVGGRLLNNATGGEGQPAGGVGFPGMGEGIGSIGGVDLGQFTQASPYQSTFGQDIFGRQGLSFGQAQPVSPTQAVVQPSQYQFGSMVKSMLQNQVSNAGSPGGGILGQMAQGQQGGPGGGFMSFLRSGMLDGSSAPTFLQPQNQAPHYSSIFGRGFGTRRPMMFANGGIVTRVPEGFIPIQTETYKGKPEHLIHPDGSITKVNARLAHEKMSDDEVTDIVIENTYVASSRPNMKLKRSVMQNYTVDLEVLPYEEGKRQKVPKEITADSLFRKHEKAILPTDYAARVAKKFPTVDKDQRTNIFTQRTNEENLANRVPYLEALIQEGEANRMKKEQEQTRREFAKGGRAQRLGYSDGSPYSSLPFLRIDSDTIDMSNTGRPLLLQADTGEMGIAMPYSGTHKFSGAKSVTEIPIMRNGGYARRSYQDGGLTGGDWASIAATALPAVLGLFSGNQRPGGPTGTLDPLTNSMLMGSFPLSSYGLTTNIRAQESSLQNAMGNLGNLNQDLMNLNNQGTLAGIGTQLAQTTDLPRYRADISRLQTFNTQSPRSFIDAQATPTMSSSSMLDRFGQRGAASILADSTNSQMQARNNAAIQQFNQDRNLDYGIANQITGITNQERQLNNQISQQEIAARNNVIGNIGSQVQGNFSNRGNILSDTFRQGTDLDMQLAQLQGQIPMGIAQNMMNMAALRQQLLAQQFAAQPSQTPQANGNPTTTDYNPDLSQLGSALGQSLGTMFGGGPQDGILAGQFNDYGGPGLGPGASSADLILSGQPTAPGAGMYMPPYNPDLGGTSFGNTGFGGGLFPWTNP